MGYAVSLELLLALITICSISVINAQSQLPPFSCGSSTTKAYPFCNVELPIKERVQDLVSRLTLDEKIFRLINKPSAIPALGVPYYQWWSEALHGVAVENGVSFKGSMKAATSFPQVIVTASTFEADLSCRMVKVIGTEARVIYYNEGQAIGLTFWSANINIFRDIHGGGGDKKPHEKTLAHKQAVADNSNPNIKQIFTKARR